MSVALAIIQKAPRKWWKQEESYEESMETKQVGCGQYENLFYCLAPPLYDANPRRCNLHG
jgi:hypothetical protein